MEKAFAEVGIRLTQLYRGKIPNDETKCQFSISNANIFTVEVSNNRKGVGGNQTSFFLLFAFRKRMKNVACGKW